MSERFEFGLELLLIDIVVEVLDVEVDTLVFEGLLVLLLLVRLLEFLLTFRLALSTSDVELLTLVILLVKVIDSLCGILVVLVVDETEALRLSFVVHRDDSRGDLSVLLEHRSEFCLVDFEREVLDVEVGEVSADFVDLGLTFTLGNVNSDVDDLVVEEHTVDTFDGGTSGFGGIVVNESVTERVSLSIDSDLAREDVSEGGKGIVKSLVVDVLVEVLDEDVSSSVLAKSGVTLRPHDSARALLDQRVVELLESALTCRGRSIQLFAKDSGQVESEKLTIRRVEVVDISVSEGTTGNGVTTDTNRGNGTDHREDWQ